MTENLSDDAERLYEGVPSDGAPIGNTSLRRQLGWDELRYWPARDSLIDLGLVETARGRGGSVRRVKEDIAFPVTGVDQVVAPEVLVEEASASLVREIQLYPAMADVIAGAFARDQQSHPLAVEITAQQGRRATGGRWSRPDIVSVEVTTFLRLPGKYLELSTFEVKPEDAVDVLAVYEALSHRRAATRSYVIFHIPDERVANMETVLDEICDEASTHGIGIIVAGKPDDYETWDYRVQAQRHSPDPARLDAFISTQLTSSTANRVAREVR